MRRSFGTEVVFHVNVVVSCSFRVVEPMFHRCLCIPVSGSCPDCTWVQVEFDVIEVEVLASDLEFPEPEGFRECLVDDSIVLDQVDRQCQEIGGVDVPEWRIVPLDRCVELVGLQLSLEYFNDVSVMLDIGFPVKSLCVSSDICDDPQRLFALYFGDDLRLLDSRLGWSLGNQEDIARDAGCRREQLPGRLWARQEARQDFPAIHRFDKNLQGV